MNAKEVDFRHEHLLAVDVDVHWDARNETEQFVLFASSDTKEPVFVIARRS